MHLYSYCLPLHLYVNSNDEIHIYYPSNYFCPQNVNFFTLVSMVLWRYEESSQCYFYEAVLKKDFPAYTGYRQPCSDIIAVKIDILMCVTV